MSGTIGPPLEPEQPPRAASALRPVLDDDYQDNATMTALAEPETIATPQPAQADPSGTTMIVFEGVKKVYEPNSS